MSGCLVWGKGPQGTIDNILSGAKEGEALGFQPLHPVLPQVLEMRWLS